MMELRFLHYFRAVAEDLSFSGAARRLHVAQPALSRAVKQLESTLGTTLLERTRHHVRLTPAGSVLWAFAGGISETLSARGGSFGRTDAGARMGNGCEGAARHCDHAAGGWI